MDRAAGMSGQAQNLASARMDEAQRKAEFGYGVGSGIGQGIDSYRRLKAPDKDDYLSPYTGGKK